LNPEPHSGPRRAERAKANNVATSQGIRDTKGGALGWLIGAAVIAASSCAPTVNVEQERSALMQRDRDWAQATKDPEKFASFLAPDASGYPPGMPKVSGATAFKDVFAQLASAPGFTLTWTADKAEVNGDLGYTTGAYELNSSAMPAPEKGKYVTIWKRQPDGVWMVVEDIFNADSGPAPAAHVSLAPASLTWGDAPPSLPPGAKMAVVAGDPGKSGPFTVRAQLPAGYKIAPHWHPTDENVTVLSGSFSLGMGEKWDEAALKDLPAGGFVTASAGMRHFAMARTAATIQVHGIGPLVLNYVNPDDDPSKKK
jgi:ketosteroid isomerase-like protein